MAVENEFAIASEKLTLPSANPKLLPNEVRRMVADGKPKLWPQQQAGLFHGP
jgi:hypothetical protein